MSPSIYARITTRDGRVRNDILAAFLKACGVAQRAGVAVEPGQTQYSYATATCRNLAVAEFLAHPRFSHLLFIDDDVTLPPDAIINLADTASAPGRDVVCGVYPMLKYYAPNVPTLYTSVLPLGKLLNSDWMADFPEGIQEVEAAGAGCMLIERSVLTALGHPWFRWPERYNPDNARIDTLTDDVDFCSRAKTLGRRVWVDGRVRCGHWKNIDLATLLDGRMSKADELLASERGGYATHLPVLMGIAAHTPVRVAVEYGSGRFSTTAFMDRSVFPDLEKLVSFESHPKWLEEVRQRCTDDRLDLRACDLSAVHEAAAPAADLVFIDCDEWTPAGVQDYSARQRLIARYADDPRAVVVVHDANFKQIRPVVDAAPYKHKRYYVPPAGPHTAVLSNAVDVSAFQWAA